MAQPVHWIQPVEPHHPVPSVVPGYDKTHMGNGTHPWLDWTHRLPPRSPPSPSISLSSSCYTHCTHLGPKLHVVQIPGHPEWVPQSGQRGSCATRGGCPSQTAPHSTYSGTCTTLKSPLHLVQDLCCMWCSQAPCVVQVLDWQAPCGVQLRSCTQCPFQLLQGPHHTQCRSQTGRSSHQIRYPKGGRERGKGAG